MHAFFALVLDGGVIFVLMHGPESWVVCAKEKIMQWIVLCVLVIGSEVSCNLCDLTLMFSE